MSSEKKRKKTSATVTTAAPDSQPAVAMLEDAPLEDGEDSSPVIDAQIVGKDLHSTQRPAWIDGAPVDESGRIIRKGLPRPAVQTDLADPDGQPGDNQSDSRQEGKPRGRSWSDPYKSIFTCPEMGFELGENRQFKQRVFRFLEKPSSAILDTLKEEGFTYRGGVEKAWTIPATPETRRLTDELARQWAGPNYIKSIER